MHCDYLSTYAEFFCFVALAVLGVGPQLVPMFIQPLNLRADELGIENPRLGQSQPHYFIIIERHSLRIDLQHLQHLLEHLLLPQEPLIQPTVKPFIEPPLALLLQDATYILLCVVLSILALKKYMAIVGVIVKVLDHFLDGFWWGWLGRTDFAFAAAGVGTFLGVREATGFVGFGWLKLLKDGLRRNTGWDSSLSFLQLPKHRPNQIWTHLNPMSLPQHIHYPLNIFLTQSVQMQILLKLYLTTSLPSSTIKVSSLPNPPAGICSSSMKS